MINIKQLIKSSKILLYLTAFTPFILAAKFIFPYMVVRAAFFRIIIELILIVFLYLLTLGRIKFSNAKNNYFLWVFIGLLLIEFIAAALGESWWFSFFGDLERMWGLFTVTHLFLFYFFIRSWFGRQEWNIFFNISLAASLLVSGYGIIQRFPEFFNIYVFEAGAGRITSTLGNPAYVSIYVLFSIAFAFYLFWQNRSEPVRYYYLAVIFINLFAFSLTEVRGAYLGAVIGSATAAALYLFLGKNKKYKIGLASLLVAVTIALAFAFSFPESVLVKNSPFLRRLATISLNDETVKTRFISWQAVWQGFKDNPVLGVGMENYNIVFNKYFPAAYYNLAPTETYFDRAHNQFLNILAESGIFALLLYLGFPFFIGYYLISAYRKGNISLPSFLILTATGIAYFVHVFFVFDDINSSLFFIVLIGFIEFLNNQDNLIIPCDGRVRPKMPVKAVSAVLILLAVVSIYRYNIKTLQAARYAASAYMSSHLDETIKYYNQSLDAEPAMADNIAINYADYLSGLGDKIDQLQNNPTMTALVDGALKRVKAELNQIIARKPKNAMIFMKLGKINNFEYLFYNDLKYIKEAETNLNKVIELSPERLQAYYLLGESYILSEQFPRAVIILEKALELNPNYKDSYYYLGRAYLANGDLDKAYNYIINKAIKEMKYQPQNNNFVLALSQTYLQEQKNYRQAVEIYETILSYDRENSDIMAALAAGYLQIGEKEKAIAMARKSAEVNPELLPGAKLFIEKIENNDYRDLLE